MGEQTKDECAGGRMEERTIMNEVTHVWMDGWMEG